MQSKKEIYEEQFKQIKGYENYLVSDRGRVFNLKFKRFRKPAKNSCGYFQVDLWKNGVGKTLKVHRLVALAFIPNPENKLTVNHIDSDRTNNFVSNLEWNTYSENSQHGFDNGLLKPPCLKGIKHGNSKLSEKEVLEIRRIFATGEYTQTALGKIFGVDQSIIGRIIRRELWTHI